MSSLTTDERTVLERCRGRNAAPADVAALRRLFAAYPERFNQITNLFEHAEMRIIEGVADSPFIEETMHSGCARVRSELGYEQAPALERLLIDAVALTWLRLALIEQQYTVGLSKAHSPNGADYWERRLSSAHGRYLRAIEALARVRRLAVPAIIQNIAAHQSVQIGGAG